MTSVLAAVALQGLLLGSVALAAGSAGPGTARAVWGYCQVPAGARLTGAWNDAADPNPQKASADACHVGMFGAGFRSGDGSLFTTELCAFSDSTKDAFRPNSAMCTCLAVPQCGRGIECGLDCSCDVADATSASTVENYFSAGKTIVFEGEVRLSTGPKVPAPRPVKCNATVNSDPGWHVVGYQLSVVADKATRTLPCGGEGTNIAKGFDYATWGCTIQFDYSQTALEAATASAPADAFAQRVLLTAGAARGAAGASVAALVLAAVLSVAGREWSELRLL